MIKSLFFIVAVFFIIFSTVSPSLAQNTKKEKREARKERRAERRKQWKEELAFRAADYHLYLITENGDSAIYEDNNISAKFSLSYGIGIELKNKLNKPITIIWNSVSIVMPDGTSEKIMHNGIKYIDRGKSMPNTIIPPQAKIEDKLIPVDKVEWRGRYGWGENPIFRTTLKVKEAVKDKTMSVFMPIILPSGEKKYYNFKFKIKVY